MRRMRHYDYLQNEDVESSYGEVPRLPYFLHEKLTTDSETAHSSMQNHSHHFENHFSTGIHMSDNSKNQYPYKENESDGDEIEVYDVASDGYLTSSHNYNYRVRANYISDPDMRKHEQLNVYRDRRPAKQKQIVCKFCATSKQFGSCPCPIHLPTVQSRYMRVLQDNTRNALTINVFKNGDYRVTPTMIHISKFQMRSMEEIMKIVDKFVRFPVGYAYALYTVLGDLVENPRELLPYEMYVVVNNCKKQFVPLDYGSKRLSSLNTNTSRRRRMPPQSNFTLTPFTIRE